MMLGGVDRGIVVSALVGCIVGDWFGCTALLRLYPCFGLHIVCTAENSVPVLAKGAFSRKQSV